MPTLDYVVLAVSATVVSVLCTPLVRALARRVGALDVPGPRRVHAAEVPRLGGLAVLAALMAALVVDRMGGGSASALLTAHGRSPAWLLAGVGVVVTAGVLDDLVGLRVRSKLVLQVVAAVLAVVGGYGLEGFTNPLTGQWVALDRLGGVVTVVWILAITNAINLIDGLDGLAAGVGVIAAAALGLVALSEGRADAAGLWVALGGSLAGFLVYNFPPASIFLGDTGSLLVGYVIAILGMQSLSKGATAVVALAPILALGLPLMDTALAVVRRVLVSGVAGIVRADRDHIHHRLLSEGMSQRRALLVLYGACVACGALAFLAVVTQGVAKALVVGVAVVAIWLAVQRLRAGRTS